MEDIPLSLSVLNLGEAFTSFKDHAYWKVKILDYDTMNQAVYTEIISYHTGDIPFSTSQLNFQTELENIKKIYFTKIETTALYQTYSRNKKDLTIIASNKTTTPEFSARGYVKQRAIEPYSSGQGIIHVASTMVHLRDVEPFPTLTRNKSETVEIDIEALRFGNGKESFLIEKLYLGSQWIFR